MKIKAEHYTNTVVTRNEVKHDYKILHAEIGNKI